MEHDLLCDATLKVEMQRVLRALKVHFEQDVETWNEALRNMTKFKSEVEVERETTEKKLQDMKRENERLNALLKRQESKVGHLSRAGNKAWVLWLLRQAEEQILPDKSSCIDMMMKQ